MSPRAIARASALAFLAAVIVLVTAVLPAEFGLDPLGTGRALGLLNLFNAAPPPIAAAADGPVVLQETGFRTDSRKLTVPSLGSVEFKYQMAKGAVLVYSWRATAPIDFDFHTEPAGLPPSASETFERGSADLKQGSYTAPYDGIHGWYWENFYDADVVVTLDAAGFFSGGVLFQTGKAPERIAIAGRQ